MSREFPKPTFQISRVYDDGAKEELEVVPITGIDFNIGMDRRGVLGTGIAVSSLLSGLAGCGKPPGPVTPKTPKADATSRGPLRAHRAAITGLTLAPDGKTLVTAGQDDGLKMWSFPSGELRSPFNTQGMRKNGFQALLLTPDGKRLVTETHDLISEISVRSFPDGESTATLLGHSEPVQGLSVSNDSKLLASAGGNDKTARVWSLPDGKPLATFEGHTGTVTSAKISPDGSTLYTGDSDGSVRVWSIPDKKFLRTLEPKLPSISDLTIAANGRTIVAGSGNGAVQVWSADDNRLLASTKYHNGRIRGVQIDKDGDTVVTGSEDGSVKRWSISKKRVIDDIGDRFGGITRLLLSPDGLMLVIGTVLGTIALWDVIGRKLRSFLFDKAIAPQDTQGISYSLYDSVLGRVVIFTLPCGTPLPAGATCTCNCVAGLEPPAYRAPEPPVSRPVPQRVCTCESVCRCVPQRVCTCESVCRCVPQRICTCERVCTCVPQCICQAV